MREKTVLKIGLIGFGAIGKKVAQGLLSEQEQNAVLAGVYLRKADPELAPELQFFDFTEFCDHVDLVVECAGTGAVAEFGQRVIASGRDFFVTSVGAIADSELRASLLTGPGRSFFSSGAVGGLDILAAASRDGGLTRAELVSTKLPQTLLQPWMEEAERSAIKNTTVPLTIFEGGALAAIKHFPKSLNVGVALAHATGLWEETRVCLVADPAAENTKHEITASGPSGSYHFQMVNLPDEVNPATSGVVAKAVLSGIERIAKSTGCFM